MTLRITMISADTGVTSLAEDRRVMLWRGELLAPVLAMPLSQDEQAKLFVALRRNLRPEDEHVRNRIGEAIATRTDVTSAASIKQGRDIHDAVMPLVEWALTDSDDYRTLADSVIELTNPPDGDDAEIAIVLDAVARLVEFVKDAGCECPAQEMGDDYGAADACPRCRALGMFSGKIVER